MLLCREVRCKCTQTKKIRLDIIEKKNTVYIEICIVVFDNIYRYEFGSVVKKKMSLVIKLNFAQFFSSFFSF